MTSLLADPPYKGTCVCMDTLGLTTQRQHILSMFGRRVHWPKCYVTFVLYQPHTHWNGAPVAFHYGFINFISVMHFSIFIFQFNLYPISLFPHKHHCFTTCAPFLRIITHYILDLHYMITCTHTLYSLKQLFYSSETDP